MKILLTALVIATSLFTVNCSNEKIATSQQAVDPTNPVNPLASTSSNIAPLNVEISVLDNFLKEPTNTPENVRVYVDLAKNSDETYSGEVAIYVTDRGVTESYTFRTGLQSHSKYNKWIKNESAFHAILDDGKNGMIVLVIDEVYNLGDGSGNQNIAGGRIFYKNYPYVYHPYIQMAPHPQQENKDIFCWEINGGPYDCSPWANLIEADSEAWPMRDTLFLGTFDSLSLSESLKESNFR